MDYDARAASGSACAFDCLGLGGEADDRVVEAVSTPSDLTGVGMGMNSGFAGWRTPPASGSHGQDSDRAVKPGGFRRAPGPSLYASTRLAKEMSDNVISESTDELVEYCTTRARLLLGHSETIREETDGLLADIERDISEVRSRLAERAGRETPSASPSTPRPATGSGELEDFEKLETDLERRQTLAEAKQARSEAFLDLAGKYFDLAEELESTVDDGREALDRVVRFERAHDAPRYFEDRRTLLETAVESETEDIQ